MFSKTTHLTNSSLLTKPTAPWPHSSKAQIMGNSHHPLINSLIIANYLCPDRFNFWVEDVMGVIMIGNNFSECEGVLLLTGTGCAPEPEWLLAPSRPIRAQSGESLTNQSRALGPVRGTKVKINLDCEPGPALTTTGRGDTGRHYTRGGRHQHVFVCLGCDMTRVISSKRWTLP